MQIIKGIKGYVLVSSLILLGVMTIPVLDLITVNSSMYILSSMLILLSMFGIVGSGLIFIIENEEKEKQFAIMYINQQLQYLRVSLNDINARQLYFNELSRRELNNIACKLENEIARKHVINEQNQC